MHEMNVADILLFLIPSMSIVIGMTVTLSYSFWKYHKRKKIQRQMQHDYLEVFLSVKRPRIGALRCNTHFTKWTDMAQSLSHSDFNRLSRYHHTSMTSPRLYSTSSGPYLQNGYLGPIREDDYNRPFITIDYPSDNVSLSSSIPGEPYQRNSYYEDRGLPPVPRKNVNKPSAVQEQRRPSIFTTTFNIYSNTTKSSSDSELNNRITEVKDSPRKLGSLEDGYWKRDSSRCQKPKRSARKHSKKARSLSQQYEYDLNLQELLKHNQQNAIVDLDIYNGTGVSEQYTIPEPNYNGSRYPVPDEELQIFNHKIHIANPKSGLQNQYHGDSRTLNTKSNLKVGTHNPNKGLQQTFHKTVMENDKYHLGESAHNVETGLSDQYTSIYNPIGNTNNPNFGSQNHYYRTLSSKYNSNESGNSGLQNNFGDTGSPSSKYNNNDSDHGSNNYLQNQHCYLNSPSNKCKLNAGEHCLNSEIQSPHHWAGMANNNKYTLNESALVWVNLEDIPQSSV